MKRKLLATLLALCLIVGMIPVAASADSMTDCPGGDTCTHAAAIGNTHYDTLQEAIDAVSANENNHVIEVLRNLQPEDVGAEKQEMRFTKEGQSVTLELNQHEITTAYEEAIHINAANVTLTIQNGTIRNYYNIGNYSDGLYAFQNSNNLTLTLDNVTLDSRTQTLAVQGLTSNSNVTIRNSTLNSDEQLGIYYPPKSGVLTIENSVITAGTGVVVKGGTVNILGEETKIVTDGNKVVPEDYYTGATDGSSSLTMTGDALYVESGYNDRDIVVNVQNGTLKSTNSYAIQMFVKTDEEVAVKRDVAVSGGTFSSDVSEYVADGYTMVESDDEYVVEPLGPGNSVAQVGENYFDSLEEAISAAENNSTVILLKNYDSVATGTITVPEGKSIVLDLNGYTVKFSQDFSPILVNGQITIQDTITGGTICSNKAIEVDKGTLTLKSGTIEVSDDYGIYVSNDGHAAVNGGAISSLYAPFTGNNLTGDMNFTVTDGTLTAKYGPAIYMPGQGKLDISGGTLNGGISLRMGQVNISGGTINATTGSIDSPTEYYHYSGNAWLPDALYVFNGTYTSESELCGNSLKLNITGGTFNCANDQGSAVAIYDLGKVEQSSTVTISGDARFSTNATDRSAYQVLSLEDIGVDSPESGYGTEGLVGNVFTSITSGYFTTDPSEYLAEGLMAVTSDVPGYAFTVGTSTVEEVKPAAGDPAVDLTKIPVGQQTAVESAASSVTDSGELAAAANTVLENASEQKDAAVNAFKESEIEGASEADNVTVYAQTYLSVTPTFYDVADENKTLTMDITPMYRVVASTKDNPEDIKVVGETEGTPNAVVLDGSEKELDIQTMTITLTLPSGFVSENNTVYIQHKGYEYSATADADCKITFTNPHGFSEFTFTTDSKTVATIDGTSYTSLQAAVDDATSDDIIVVKNGNVDLSATAYKTVKVMNGTKNNIKVTINGVSKTIGQNKIETFVYTSGGGTPSEPEEPTWPFTDVTEGGDWFYDAVAYVYENGIMAGTGETTFEPYMELDRAMAAQLFYNLEGKPAVTGDSTFTDVTSGHWAVDAITWAAQNDIVVGIGGGLYDPDSNVTREQFAVMLYKYARFKGYDLTAAGDLTQFPDAGSISSWAETALSWANGKGLINGHENGTIDPKGSTIRAQAASIMANFDQNVAK